MGSQYAPLMRQSLRPAVTRSTEAIRPSSTPFIQRRPSAPDTSKTGVSKAMPRDLTSLPILAPRENSATQLSPDLRPSIPTKLSIGSVNDPLEAEADTMAARAVGQSPNPTSFRVSRAQAAAGTMSTEAPPIVHEELRSPGKPLDPNTRAFFEPRLGHDLSNVRVHTGLRAEESARAINASAYTAGQDTVFAAGQYQPDSGEGRKLIAHELSHTVQQSRGPGSTPSSPVPQIYRQEAKPQKPEAKPPQPVEATVSVTWDDLLNRKLTLPSLLQAPQRQPLLPSPGTLTLGGPSPAPSPVASLFNFPPLTSGSPLGSGALVPPTLSPSGTPGPNLTTPTPGSGQPAQAAPAAPSRLSVINSGSLSIGLRLGFPDLQDADKPGSPPSAAQQALQQGQIINQIITGQVPSAWQALDKGKLAGAVWGIFSTYIAPDAARKITSSLSGKIGKSGPSYELDAVLLTDFSGGGISFTLRR